MNSFKFLFFSLILSLCDCSKENEPKQIVAQVGNSVLTLKNLQMRFPPEYRAIITKEQYLDYIKRWMDEEILYQHALEIHLDKDPEVAKNLYDVQKKMTVEHLLAKELANLKFTPEDAAMRQYYENHQQDYMRSEPEVRVLTIKVKGDKLAWEILNKIKEDNFWDLAKKYSIDPLPESITHIPFKQQTELNSCIAEKAFKMRIGGTSAPQDCGDSFVILRVVEKNQPGTLKSFEEVQDEIKTILTGKWQKRNLAEKIDALKKEIYFSSNLDLIPESR